jgi:hypothetical protein
MSGRRIELTGRRFGRWLVVAIHPERKRTSCGVAAATAKQASLRTILEKWKLP